MRFLIVSLVLMGLGCSKKSSNIPNLPNSRPTLDFCSAGERPIVVTNKSSQPVWVGLTSGTFYCNTNADCANMGGNCDTSKNVCRCTAQTPTCGTLGVCSTGNFQCFWKLPRMIDAVTPQLAPTQSLKLCFPAPLNAKSIHGRQTNALSSVQWSGNLFARLGCDANGQNCNSAVCSQNNAGCSTCSIGEECTNTGSGFTCKSKGTTTCSTTPCTTCGQTTCGPGYTPPLGHTYAGDCPNNGNCAPQDGTCNAGTGGVPPASLAEFTFTAPQPNLDYYDVSIINGINIGISMEPDSNTTTKSQTDPYFCTTPGAQTQNDPLGILRPCNWTITPPTISDVDTGTLLKQVKPTTPITSCTSDNNCATGQVCGLAQNTGFSTVAKVCGTFVAYWSADQICGTNPSDSNILPLICSTQNTNLFGCTGGAGSGSTSCYQDVTQCDCGCPTLLGNPYVNTWPKVLASQGNCQATNNIWVNNIQPWLVFMKQACPTAYTFPFDDKTSTFTCHANSGTNAGEAPGYYVDFFDLK